jgi:hypothetical protein
MNPPLFAVCAMNTRKIIMKKYGPGDLATVGTQTEDSDFPLCDDDCVVRMRNVYEIIDLE